MKRFHLLLLAGASASLVWFGAVRAGKGPGVKPELPAPAAPLSSLHSRGWSLRNTPIVEVVNHVRDAVVNIHSERTVRGPATEEIFALAPSQNRINGMGTGILIDPRGYIITNQHVVEDVNLIRVRLSDRTEATARVLARDSVKDLALLKISVPRPLAIMPLGTATDLMVGETVLAIGNAYGYEHTVTVGVVSAKARDVTLNKDIKYEALIQTDAAINPGNSGGPLLNVQGDLIGVNVAIRAGAQGIGFAIPVDHMIQSAAGMLAAATSREGAAGPGMTVKDQVHPDSASGLRTVVVERVETGGPAAQAGLHSGDELLEVGDIPVTSSMDLPRGLLEHKPGDRVPVAYRRNGARTRTELVVEGTAQAGGVSLGIWRKLGLRLEPAGAEAVTRTHPQLHGGMRVTEVRDQGVAARAGVQIGDILVGLHQYEMLSLDNVSFVINNPDLASFLPLRFYVLRNGQIHRGTLASLD